MATDDKLRLVPVTDPTEIEAVRRELATGELELPVGEFIDGQCFAEAWSLERYRQRVKR